MNNIPIKSLALGLAFFSFGFLTIGSVIFGATFTTAILRGLGGGIFFGIILWLTGDIVDKGGALMDETTSSESREK